MNRVYLGDKNWLEKKLACGIIDLKKDSPLAPVWVVVDSNLSGVYLRRRMVQQGVNHINVRFLTLPDLAGELLTGVNEAANILSLPYFGEERIVEIITSRLSEDSYFAPVSEYKGFSISLQQTLRELKETGYSIEEKMDLLSGIKKDEMKQLYRNYIVALSGFHDSDKFNISNISKVKLLFYACYRFNSYQKDFIKKISDNTSDKTNANKVYSGLSFFLPKAITTVKTGREFKVWLQESGFTILNQETKEDETVNNLNLLKNNLFKSNRNMGLKVPPDDESVEIWSAPGEVKEVQEIARKIVSMAGEGHLFRDMAILVKDSLYYSIIKDTLSSLKIPCYIPAGKPLTFTRTGRALLMLLQLNSSNWKRREVMDFLMTAPINYRRILKIKKDPSPPLWDYLSIRAGIVSGMDEWDHKIKAMVKRMKSEIIRNDAGASDNLVIEEGQAMVSPAGKHLEELHYLYRMIKKLFKIFSRIPKKSGWNYYIQELEKTIQDLMEDGEETQALLDAIRPLRGLEVLEEEIDFTVVKDMLESVLQRTSLPLGEFQKGVAVIPVEAAFSLSFPVVFIPGLLEKRFPAPFQQDPLLLDEERKALGGELSLRSEAVHLEKISFVVAVSSSLEKLILTYPRFDSLRGGDMFPSHYLMKVGEAINGIRLPLDNAGKLPGFRHIPSTKYIEPEEALTPQEFAENLLKKSSIYGSVLDFFTNKYPWFATAVQADYNRRSMSFSPYDGLIVDKKALRLIEENYTPWEKNISVTGINNYLFCPYFYFLNNMLELVTLEEPEEMYRMGPMEKGLLTHQILELFYRCLDNNQGEIMNSTLSVAENYKADHCIQNKTTFQFRKNDNALLEQLSKAVDDTFYWADEEGTSGYPLFRDIDKEQIKWDLFFFLKKEFESILIPQAYYLEQSFGWEGSRAEKTRPCMNN